MSHFVARSCCISRHFRRGSLLALFCGQSDALPLFRTLGGLPAGKFGSTDGLFRNLSRCYAVQSVRDTKEAEQRLINKSCGCCQPSADVKSSDSATGVESCSDNSVATEAASEEHSHRTSNVEQTAVDSSEMVSQKETSQKVGLVQRFRMMYKQYGVVLVCVHAVTSSVWFSLFYCATVRYS